MSTQPHPPCLPNTHPSLAHIIHTHTHTPLLVKRVNWGYLYTPIQTGTFECGYTPAYWGYTKYECDYTPITWGYPNTPSIGDMLFNAFIWHFRSHAGNAQMGTYPVGSVSTFPLAESDVCPRFTPFTNAPTHPKPTHTHQHPPHPPPHTQIPDTHTPTIHTVRMVLSFNLDYQILSSRFLFLYVFQFHPIAKIGIVPPTGHISKIIVIKFTNLLHGSVGLMLRIGALA